jgi:hypothetical protein
MPLADYAELQTELAAKPEFLTQLFEDRAVDAIKHLTGKGHVVKPKADYDSEVETKATEKAKTLNQEAIDNEGAKLYPSIDNMLTVATGRTKPAGMKTRDWVNSLADEDLLPFTDTQIAKLKAAMKGEGGNPVADSVIKDLNKKIEDLQNGVKETETKAFQRQAAAIVKAELRNANVPIDSSLKDDAAKSKAKNEAINDLTDFFNSKYEAHSNADGDVYFTKKGSTEALTNSAENRPMNPLEIIKQNHKALLAVEGHQQSGGGSGKPSGGGATTLESIYKAAAAAGHAFNSKAWREYVTEQKKQANIK